MSPLLSIAAWVFAPLAQAAPSQPSLIQTLGPLVLIFGLFYLLVMLPAQRKRKQHDQMLSQLGAGEKVITTGGLVGTIVKADETTLRLKLAPSVEVTLLRSHVAGKWAGEEKTT